MFGLTSLGIVHTAISLIAVAAGAACLFRDQEISLRTPLGRVYVATTVLTCLTSFPIFQHGGFGKPHALGIITLVVLLIAYVSARTALFGRASPYVEVVSYSATFFFHLIPAVTETLTRLPSGSPVFDGPDAPGLQTIDGVMFILFIAGAAAQVRRRMNGNAAALTSRLA